MNYRILAKACLASLMLFTAEAAAADTVHVAKKGETIFGIAHLYYVTVDQLLQWNPQAANGVKKGMEIIIKDGSTPELPEAKPETKPEAKLETKPEAKPEIQPEAKSEAKPEIRHEVEEKPLVYVPNKKESMKSIAKKTGVSKDRLIELNPFLDPDKVQPGERVRLSEYAPVFDDSEPETRPETEETAEVADSVVVAPDKGRNILVLLPFMANSDERSKQAQYYADFYRGMLLAAHDANTSLGLPVEIIAADTKGSTETLRRELEQNAENSLAVIIAPEDESQLKPIADFAAENEVYALNVFNFKDQSYKTNPFFIQGNIDQPTMYAKAVEGIKKQYPDYVPVILVAEGARAEKEGFTSLLEQSYAADGLSTLKISFDEALSEADFSELNPLTKYVFIPQSGSISVFNKIAGAILRKKQLDPEHADNFALFGYPDWTAFRGETLDLLHDLNATVYSRFYFNESDPQSVAFQKKFDKWYGSNTIEAVPDQGMLGYDTATFLLRALLAGPLADQFGSEHRGLQSAFRLERMPDGGGLLNTSLFLIRYQPGTVCSAIVL